MLLPMWTNKCLISIAIITTVLIEGSQQLFQCPQTFGHYADSEDCSKYYICDHGKPKEAKCKDGLVYNSMLQTCDWPRNVECFAEDYHSTRNTGKESAGPARGQSNGAQSPYYSDPVEDDDDYPEPNSVWNQYPPYASDNGHKSGSQSSRTATNKPNYITYNDDSDNKPYEEEAVVNNYSPTPARSYAPKYKLVSTRPTQVRSPPTPSTHANLDHSPARNLSRPPLPTLAPLRINHAIPARAAPNGSVYDEPEPDSEHEHSHDHSHDHGADHDHDHDHDHYHDHDHDYDYPQYDDYEDAPPEDASEEETPSPDLVTRPQPLPITRAVDPQSITSHRPKTQAAEWPMKVSISRRPQNPITRPPKSHASRPLQSAAGKPMPPNAKPGSTSTTAGQRTGGRPVKRVGWLPHDPDSVEMDQYHWSMGDAENFAHERPRIPDEAFVKLRDFVKPTNDLKKKPPPGHRQANQAYDDDAPSYADEHHPPPPPPPANSDGNYRYTYGGSIGSNHAPQRHYTFNTMANNDGHPKSHSSARPQAWGQPSHSSGAAKPQSMARPAHRPTGVSVVPRFQTQRQSNRLNTNPNQNPFRATLVKSNPRNRPPTFSSMPDSNKANHKNKKTSTQSKADNLRKQLPDAVLRTRKFSQELRDAILDNYMNNPKPAYILDDEDFGVDEPAMPMLAGEDGVDHEDDDVRDIEADIEALHAKTQNKSNQKSRNTNNNRNSNSVSDNNRSESSGSKKLDKSKPISDNRQPVSNNNSKKFKVKTAATKHLATKKVTNSPNAVNQISPKPATTVRPKPKVDLMPKPAFNLIASPVNNLNSNLVNSANKKPETRYLNTDAIVKQQRAQDSITNSHNTKLSTVGVSFGGSSSTTRRPNVIDHKPVTKKPNTAANSIANSNFKPPMKRPAQSLQTFDHNQLRTTLRTTRPTPTPPTTTTTTETPITSRPKVKIHINVPNRESSGDQTGKKSTWFDEEPHVQPSPRYRIQNHQNGNPSNPWSEDDMPKKENIYDYELDARPELPQNKAWNHNNGGPKAGPTFEDEPYQTQHLSPGGRDRQSGLVARPYEKAEKCFDDVCTLPDCRCGGVSVPGGLRAKQIPQIVLLTFDDSVNDLNWDIYEDLFNSGRTNPNGCPILGTFYVSHEWSDYSQIQTLYSRGHEMASHSVTHSFGEKFPKEQWFKEIAGQRELLHLYGGVKPEDVRGMRAPFLQTGGNTMFEMLYEANFTYDSSLPVYDIDPPFWPYTLDYAIKHECMITPCPSKSYPGFWEVGMVMWQDLRGGRCSMADACFNPKDEQGVYDMVKSNFDRHYNSNRSPFGIYYHSRWFLTEHNRKGFIRFLDEIVGMGDVFLVTNWQMIQWMRDPTPMSSIKSFQPWKCELRDRPAECSRPYECKVKLKGETRNLKTCQPCPKTYPWYGNNGVAKS